MSVLKKREIEKERRTWSWGWICCLIESVAKHLQGEEQNKEERTRAIFFSMYRNVSQRYSSAIQICI